MSYWTHDSFSTAWKLRVIYGSLITVAWMVYRRKVRHWLMQFEVYQSIGIYKDCGVDWLLSETEILKKKKMKLKTTKINSEHEVKVGNINRSLGSAPESGLYSQ